MEAVRQTGPVRAAAMLLALLLVGWLVVSGPPRRSAPARSQAAPAGASLAQAWPKAAVVDTPGVLPDGAIYTPWLYVDVSTSVGVAPTPDGTAQRVVVRAGGEFRELRRVTQDRYPNFLGFTGSGDAVFWAETTSASTTEPAQTRLWRASLRDTGAPVPLTADTGGIVFLNS
ncbi:hypothetical protein [Dactylosporangium sp. NPDC000521]|uniref:hypothetical protein n=1 Tax=Dactylosporangium sp. NPDC000521 TaxID=3363975 RepID=UPI003695A02A